MDSATIIRKGLKQHESNIKELILKTILVKVSFLDDEDVEGHIWWAKFEDLINDLLDD